MIHSQAAVVGQGDKAAHPGGGGGFDGGVGPEAVSVLLRRLVFGIGGQVHDLPAREPLFRKDLFYLPHFMGVAGSQQQFLFHRASLAWSTVKL